MYMFIA